MLIFCYPVLINNVFMTHSTLAKTSLLSVFGIALLLVGVFIFTTPQASAIPMGGVPDNIQLLDANADGTLDRITFDISNPNGDTWELTGSSPYGLVVTNFGDSIAIFSVSITSSSTANPVEIQIDLNNNDRNLLPGTSADYLELLYTQEDDINCTNCITNDSGQEIYSIASGDSDDSNTEIDSAPPYMVKGDAQTGDLDNDGQIDYIDLEFTEFIDPATVEENGSDFTVAGYSVLAAEVTDEEEVRVTFTESGSFDTGVTPVIYVGTGITDIASSANSTVSHGITPNDGAWPVMVSADPTYYGVLSPASSSFTMTFSEDLLNSSVTTSNFTAVGSGLPTITPSESSGVVTMTQSSGSFDSGTTVLVTARGDIGEIQDTAGNPLNSSGTVFGSNSGDDVSYKITTLTVSDTSDDSDDDIDDADTSDDSDDDSDSDSDDSSSSATSTTTTEAEDIITVVTPNSSGQIFGGGDYEITWSSVGDIDNVVLYYSIDYGITYSLIAYNEANDGTYTWRVPNIETNKALVKIIGRDSHGDELSTDESNHVFSIVINVTVPEDVVEPTSAISILMNTVDGGEVELNEWGKFRGETLSGVYIVKPDGTRSVFPDELTYFSWYDNFDDVAFVKDDQLGKLALSGRITIKPGSYLVKIQSEPSVYEITDGPILHHIPDEAAAVARYGEEWSIWVRDIPVVFFSDYTIGNPI